VKKEDHLGELSIDGLSLSLFSMAKRPEVFDEDSRPMCRIGAKILNKLARIANSELSCRLELGRGDQMS
jgi:hypothetical protein